MENLLAGYMVSTIGLQDEIQAFSFQNAAQKMMEKHHLISVESIAITYDTPDGGTVELVECLISNGTFYYRTGYVIDVIDETDETRERLSLLIAREQEPILVQCPYCNGSHYKGQLCPLHPR